MLLRAHDVGRHQPVVPPLDSWVAFYDLDLILHVGSCGLAALLAWARDTDDDDFDDDEDEDEADTLPNGCDQMLYDKVGHRRC